MSTPAGHVDQTGVWRESAFQLMETFDSEYLAGWEVELRPQPYGEVVFLARGALDVSLGAAVFTAQEGSLLTLLPCSYRKTRPAQARPVHVRGFGFRIGSGGSTALTALLCVPSLIPRPSPRILALLDAVVRAAVGAHGTDIHRARGLAQILLAELTQLSNGAAALPPVIPPDIQASLQFMEVNLQQALSLAEIAGVAALSSRQFTRRFMDYVGSSPMRYLRSLRLSRARGALATSDQTIGAVAALYGFADAAHFARAFRATFHVTPGEYRRQSRAREGSLDELVLNPQERAHAVLELTTQSRLDI